MTVFRASNITPEDAYKILKRAANNLKANLASMHSRLAAQDADYEFLRNIYRTLERANNQFNDLKSTPGIVEHARIQEDDPTYDVVDAFQTMQTAITTGGLAWLDANIPITGRTLRSPADWGDGTIIADVFTPAQTAGLRTQLAAVGATIS